MYCHYNNNFGHILHLVSFYYNFKRLRLSSLSLGQSYETANAESEPNIRLRESFLRHLVWEIPKNETTGCMNTIQGQSLICDDRGVVCPRETIQMDGCCPEIDIIPCHAFNECDQSASCCSIYEHCVSCCVQPNNKDTLTKFVLSTIVSLERLFGSIENQFQLCLTKCRTSSLSGNYFILFSNLEIRLVFFSNFEIEISST